MQYNLLGLMHKSWIEEENGLGMGWLGLTSILVGMQEGEERVPLMVSCP